MSGIDDYSQDVLTFPIDKATCALDSVVLDPGLEPASLSTNKGKRHLDARSEVDQAKAYYALAVARQPNALMTHVQRISLYAETADPAILGALIDLFLVLGGKGVSLRRRMLALARPLLSSQDHHALLQQLKHGEDHLSSLQLHASSTVLWR